MKPMLAHKFNIKRFTQPCFVQPKLNGLRALYQNGRLWSREEIPWKPALVEHIVSQLKSFIPPNWILDGELYCHGLSLQQINSAIAVKRNEPTNITTQIHYHVFDAVSILPFIERWQHVVTLFRDRTLTTVCLVQTFPVNDPSTADRLFASYRTSKYEGIMYRLGHHPYEPGKRVQHLLKRKVWNDAEFLIIGIEEGTGKCANMCGALVCVTPDGQQFTVGTGFDDATRREFFVNPPIGQFATVQYLNFSDEGKPLNTSFIALR